MDKLFLKTDQETIPLNQNIIEKYHLTAGTLSPFTRYQVVGEHGENYTERHPEEDPSNQTFKDRNTEPVFTTSESIDINQGVDSSVEGNK